MPFPAKSMHALVRTISLTHAIKRSSTHDVVSVLEKKKGKRPSQNSIHKNQKARVSVHQPHSRPLHPLFRPRSFCSFLSLDPFHVCMREENLPSVYGSGNVDRSEDV
jgi:hypothetical protein